MFCSPAEAGLSNADAIAVPNKLWLRLKFAAPVESTAW